MNISLLCLTLVGIFVIGNIAVSIRNAATLNPWDTVMSDYLAGHPWSTVQVVGFLSLTVALPVLSFVLHAGNPVSIPLWIAGVSLLIVVVTKLMTNTNPSSPNRDKLEWLHVKAAGIAFISVGVALGMYSFTHHAWLAFCLVCGAPIAAFVCYEMATKDELDAFEEHAVSTFEIASMIALLMPFVLLSLKNTHGIG